MTSERASAVSSAADAIVCTELVRIFTAEGVEVQALQGLNLRVARGELAAIVGASGSGKSTLLGILSGLDQPTAGSATVAGRALGSLTRKQRTEYLRTGVGFVWQQTSRNLLPYLDVTENVSLPMLLAGEPAAVRRRRIADLLDLLDLEQVAERRPVTLSGGQQQRVAIAVALANSPEVLLADEPTGELDESASVQVLEAIRRVNTGLGTTTLIVTHDPTVSEHVTRTIQIRDGRTSTEVLRTERSSESFTVIDALGRLQLPARFVDQLALHDRVRLALETDHVGVYPGTPSPVGPDDTTGPDHSAEGRDGDE